MDTTLKNEAMIETMQQVITSTALMLGMELKQMFRGKRMMYFLVSWSW